VSSQLRKSLADNGQSGSFIAREVGSLTMKLEIMPLNGNLRTDFLGHYRISRCFGQLKF